MQTIYLDKIKNYWELFCYTMNTSVKTLKLFKHKQMQKKILFNKSKMYNKYIQNYLMCLPE